MLIRYMPWRTMMRFEKERNESGSERDRDATENRNDEQ